MSRCEVDGEVWDRFIERHWDRKQPGVWRKPLAEPIAGKGEILAMLVDRAERFRAGETAGTLLCEGHASRTVDIGRHLPRRTDASLRAYADRVNQAFGSPFALIVHGPHAASFPAYQKIRRFIGPLRASRDLADAIIDTDVFAGTYRMTPQGVHVDAASNFAFVIDGTKRMLVWPPDVFAEHPDRRAPRSEGGATFIDTLELQSYRERAVVLEGGPGDVLFWPASWWHVGEAADDFVVTWNLSVFRGHRRVLIERRLRTDPDSPIQLASDLAETAAKLTGAGPALETWLARVEAELDSAGGMSVVPPPLADVPMSVSATVVLPAPSAVVCRHIGADFVLAAHGHSVILPESSGADQIVAALKDGPIVVRALLDRLPSLAVADVRAVVKSLLQTRGLERV